MTKVKNVKKMRSFRISEEGFALLLRLSELYGISQADVIEMLIREKARTHERQMKQSKQQPE